MNFRRTYALNSQWLAGRHAEYPHVCQTAASLPPRRVSRDFSPEFHFVQAPESEDSRTWMFTSLADRDAFMLRYSDAVPVDWTHDGPPLESPPALED